MSLTKVDRMNQIVAALLSRPQNPFAARQLMSVALLITRAIELLCQLDDEEQRLVPDKTKWVQTDLDNFSRVTVEYECLLKELDELGI